MSDLDRLVALGLISQKMALDVSAAMKANGWHAIEAVYELGLKHAVDRGTILDAYYKFRALDSDGAYKA